MSGETRPARVDELGRLWPAVRAAHLAGSLDELVDASHDAPWSVRVSQEGDALMLSRWRAGLDVLAVRAIWAPERRIPALLKDAAAVARSEGFGRLLSPLVERRRAEPYLSGGLAPFAELIGFTRTLSGLPNDRRSPDRLTVRAATRDDVAACVALDAECFEEFWRHGTAELEQAVTAERVAVAQDADGAGIGYTVSARAGSAITIGRLAVAPHARCRGVGSALVADALGWGASVGAVGVSLCTQAENEAARRLYRSAGFSEAAEPYLLLLAHV